MWETFHQKSALIAHQRTHIGQKPYICFFLLFYYSYVHTRLGSFLPPAPTPQLHGVFLSKTNTILTGKQCARCSCLSHGWFSFKRYMCFFNLAHGPFWKKMSLYSPRDVRFPRSVPFKNKLRSHMKPCASCFSFQHRLFSLRDTFVSWSS
jgi:hypothetical protein